jgi:hypothetical protein
MSQIVAAHIAGHLLSGASTSFLGPINNLMTVGANFIAPLQLPPFGAVIDCYHKGQVGPNDFLTWGRISGMWVGNEDDNRRLPGMWRSIVAAAKPRFSPYEAVNLIQRGLYNELQFPDTCKWAGMLEQWQQDAIRHSTNTLDASAVLEQYRLDTFDGAWCEQQISWGGYAESDRYTFLTESQAVQPATEVSKWFRQGRVSGDLAANHIAAGRNTNPAVHAALSYSDVIAPNYQTIGKLVQLGLLGPSENFSTTLMLEYPFEWQTWFGAISDGVSLDNVIPLGNGSNQWTNAQLNWASHWRILTVQEVTRWRDIQRAGAAGLAEYQNIGTVEITDGSVTEACRQEGILPYYRPFVVAASYTPFGHREILQVGEYAGLTAQQLLGYCKLDGFSDTNATLMATALGRHIRYLTGPWFKSEPNRWNLQGISDFIELFLYGQIDTGSFSQGLMLRGFEANEIAIIVNNIAYHQSVVPRIDGIAELKKLAWSATGTSAKALIQTWLYGGYTDAQIQTVLAGYGLAQWEVLAIMEMERVQLAASKQREIYNFQQRLQMEAQTKTWARILSSVQSGLTDGPTAINLLVTAGDSLAHATAEVNVTLAAVHERHVGSIVDIIHKAYMGGQLSAAGSAQQLLRLGLVQPAVTELVTTWTAELGPNHHVMSASDILRYVKEGLLPAATAGQMLTNLGWSGMEAKLALAEAESALVKGQAATAKASAAQRAAAAKQLLATAKALQAQQKATVKAAQQYVSMGTLKTWFQQGIVDEQYVREWFAASNYPVAAVDGFIDSWQHPQKPVTQAVPENIPASETIPSPVTAEP